MAAPMRFVSQWTKFTSVFFCSCFDVLKSSSFYFSVNNKADPGRKSLPATKSGLFFCEFYQSKVTIKISINIINHS